MRQSHLHKNFAMMRVNSATFLLSIGSFTLGMSVTTPSFAEDKNPVALVQSQRPVQQSLVDTLTLYGTVQNDPSSVMSLSLPQAGQIAQIFVTVGQHVARGALLVMLNTDPQVLQNTAQARSALILAQGEVKRTQALLAAHLATQSQLATATKAQSDAEATLQMLERQGGISGQQTLRAPGDALVLSVASQIGERLTAGTVVMQLTKANALQALIGVTPEQLPRLRAGMNVHLQPVFGGTTAAAMTGVLLRTDGIVNAQTGRIDLPVRLNQPVAAALRAGLPIKAEISLAGDRGWVVPRNAVLQDEQGVYIYQIKQHHAVRVPVHIGMQTNKSSAISGAIDPKLNIVIVGNYTLEDGMAVREQGQ